MAIRAPHLPFFVLLFSGWGCGERPTPVPAELPAPSVSSSVARPWGLDDRRVPGTPDSAGLAWWNGSAARGVCWNEGTRLVCHRLTESCGVGDALPSPLPQGAVRTLASGDKHTCAVTMDGAVECWGSNEDAQLGSKEAGPVALASKAVGASAGFDHSCATLITGAVQCWGDNATGQLGVPGIPDDGVSPRFLPADPSRTIRLGGPAQQVSAGGGHTCAVLASGELRCWGDARGHKLGHALSVEKALTTKVAVDGPVLRVVAGMWTTCAVLRDGRVQCWGENERGLLCDGGPSRPTPTTIPLPLRAVDLAVGETRACAVLEDGRLACWGGVCQAPSCGAPMPVSAGTCAPAVFGGGAGPARTAIVGDQAFCQRTEGTPPTCACLPR